MPAFRPPRWLPRRPVWHAILTLQRPRRAQLRTRVLAGVLAVTVIALVAFDSLRSARCAGTCSATPTLSFSRCSGSTAR